VDGPVLELARQDALFPVADALLPKEDGANEEEEKPRSRKPADLGDAPREKLKVIISNLFTDRSV
jgi:hypothetical protein